MLCIKNDNQNEWTINAAASGLRDFLLVLGKGHLDYDPLDIYDFHGLPPEVRLFRLFSSYSSS